MMEQEIINLADDIELKGNKRELFIKEMKLIINLVIKLDLEIYLQLYQ